MENIKLIEFDHKKSLKMNEIKLERHRIQSNNNNHHSFSKLPPISKVNNNYFPDIRIQINNKSISCLREPIPSIEKSILSQRTPTAAAAAAAAPVQPSFTPVEKLNTNVYYWYFNESQITQPKSEIIHLPELQVFIGKQSRLDDDDCKSTTDSNRTTSFNCSQLSGRKVKVKKLISSTAEADDRKSHQSIDYYISKKRFLSSAKLRSISMSEKFIKEAKKMIFAPKTNCFYPITIANHLIKNKIC